MYVRVRIIPTQAVLRKRIQFTLINIEERDFKPKKKRLLYILDKVRGDFWVEEILRNIL